MKAPKTTEGLKTFLLDQMVDVAEGNQEPVNAKAICNYVQQVYNITNLELKYAAMRHRYGPAAGESIKLIGDK